ncbi:MAG: hypothetical protein LBC60_13790 [Spirochaetaceae bacterium]|jgi:hypothetical protein|nr:hypothetical protein [Spirochaetaceae bacterium]
MLYPKREHPLRPEEFKHPGSEYRGAPFWAWNNRLEKDELLWQIEELKKMGFGGFHIHVRTGMATEYLSDEYMEMVKACVEKARVLGMLAWLYDEDRWPSGSAGGLVTRQKQYRVRHLLLTQRPYGAAVPQRREKFASSSSIRSEDGDLVACFEVNLNEGGELEQYRSIGEGESVRGIKLYAYNETALPNPWYNNQTYVNTLDPQAIREFIRVTHERYGAYFSGDFGGLIPAIFTDEPQFSQKGQLFFAHEARDVILPWTDDIAETYREVYPGEDLLASLPELLWELPGGRISRIRYHYHDHIAERFAAAFADQCGAWCAEHGIALTGHLDEEPTLESQTALLGEAMRSYRSFQLPGIDMLCDWREFTTAKQAQSAARQYGRPGVVSELYGVTNWDFDFRGHKLQGDWQAALGVTVRVPHLSLVSMNGEAKRDYPATFNYQVPWYKEYPYVEDHFARIAAVLTRGKAVVRVGVIHPIESYWLHWGPKEQTQAVREQMDRNFLDLADWLLRGLIDFDYIAESTLPELCDPADIRKGAGFPVGEMSYDLVIVPGMETIRSSTFERLLAFRNGGGRLLFLGDAPGYIDAEPHDGCRKLRDRSESIGFERLPLLEALHGLREVEIRDGSGAERRDLLYQLREEGGAGAPTRWLFIAHGDRPVNPDIPVASVVRIRLRGEWAPSIYDTITGDISPLPAESGRGWTRITRPFYEHDSLLIRLDRGRPALSGDSGSAESSPTLDGYNAPALTVSPRCFTGPVPVTLHEPNVLLLDMAEYALDNEPYRPPEEILRLDTILRGELGWPLRMDAVAQPWVESDTAVPHILRLRYTFESQREIEGAELGGEFGAETASITQVTLNDEDAGPVTGWYVDRCIRRRKLPRIKAGLNTLCLCLPYGRKINVEALYLLGDFGVEVRGTRAVLTQPVRSLAFGDITRQGLPFYGGNLTYHLETECSGGGFEIAATCYRGQLLRVKVDGEDKGVIAYSPYRLAVQGLTGSGPHKIELEYFGSRINTFGQLHAVDRLPGHWWGPNSWRSAGPAWTYEYHFWPQGVLKSPEIVTGP